MKIFLSILLVFSIHTFSDDHKKLDPIIFMLDLSVNDGKIKKAEKFMDDWEKRLEKKYSQSKKGLAKFEFICEIFSMLEGRNTLPRG